MKKVTIEITAPKADESWKLPVSKDVPETLDEWKEWCGESNCTQALERFLIIRGQDLGRRLKTGGKNKPSQSDATIVQAVRAFKFGLSISVSAPVTKEVAVGALKGADDKTLMETIAELQREIARRAKEAKEAEAAEAV